MIKNALFFLFLKLIYERNKIEIMFLLVRLLERLSRHIKSQTSIHMPLLLMTRLSLSLLHIFRSQIVTDLEFMNTMEIGGSKLKSNRTTEGLGGKGV